MANGTLRVLARGTAQVPNYEAQDAGRNARVTHATIPIGPEFVDAEIGGGKRRHAAFVKHVGRVLTLPDRAEYRRHLRDGDLWPADAETAASCGVAFDPLFGGEHTDEVLAEHHAVLVEMAGDDPAMKAWISPLLPKDKI